MEITQAHIDYIEKRPPFVLREALDLGIYNAAFADYVRRVLDRHDATHRDPLLKPPTADELRLRD